MTAFIVVPSIVIFLVSLFCGLGYLIGSAIGIPHRLGLPFALRSGGVLFLIAGFVILRWVFRYRSPADILVSTYVTMGKTVSRARPHARVDRPEPLMVSGPHRYVRHPLYSAAILLVTGWWLVLDYSFLLLAAFFLLLWFNFVIAPFEERELKALFGVEYEAYARETPRFVPYFHRRRDRDTER